MEIYRALGTLLFVIVLVFANVSFGDITEEDFVAYWLLDEGDGDETTDGSGHEHHGTITNGKWVAGQIGGGLEFDGQSTFVEVGHSDTLNLGNSMTLAAWAKIDSLPMQHIGIPRKETEYVLHPTDAGGNGFNLRFYVGIGGAWAAPVISDTVVDYGDWHHLAGTYDGEQLQVYIDGKLDKSQAQAGETGITQNPLRWSNDCCGGRMLEAVLDELAILNRALDEVEIQQLMGGIVDALSVDHTGKLATTWAQIRSK
jgi:hypothetical protein